MKENTAKAMLVLSAAAMVVLYLLLRRPGDLASSSTLAIFIGIEIIAMAVVRYSTLFLPAVIVTFLGAGLDIPSQGAFAQARWVVLGVGAVVGVATYMRSRNHYFGAFHLLALFCMLSAGISASVSAYPGEAGMKAGSLALLFVYTGSGGRLSPLAFGGESFFRGVLITCELLTWFSAVSYFLLRVEIFGNPNSLGAIAGVVLVPVLLWGILASAPGQRRARLAIELLVCGLLLMSSFSRAGICAAFMAFFLMCVALRRYRFMIKGLAVVLLLAFCAVAIIPHTTQLEDISPSEGLANAYLYKGKMQAGILGSRESVWQETVDSIKESPWFGTGFGTSKISGDLTAVQQYALSHTFSLVSREHGNSYLAIAEWTGLLGVLPFYALIGVAAFSAGKVFVWLRRTGNIHSAAVPAATIVAAGVFHAMFEDWLFAVGYYLSLFFWVIAFILIDLLPWRAVVLEPASPVPLPRDYLPVAAGQ